MKLIKITKGCYEQDTLWGIFLANLFRPVFALAHYFPTLYQSFYNYCLRGNWYRLVSHIHRKRYIK